VVHFLALGDSYTIGESVEASERWPAQLTVAMRNLGVQAADPVITAQTGWTTDELIMGLDQANLGGEYDLVSLQIGVNNQYRGLDIQEYRLEIRALLKRAIAFGGGDPGKVIVLSIPDWGATPFANGRDRDRVAREIDRFNRVCRQETELVGASYIDVTWVSRLAAQDSTLTAMDELHPSGKMYAIWVQSILPVALSILDEKHGK
jgi:lysophospholipase L1-like esterase